MSRRIFFPAVAAVVALIAPQALADSDCFENSCRMPAVVEPPAPPPPAPPPVPIHVDVVRPAPAQPAVNPVQPRREVVQQAPQIVDEPLAQRIPSQRVAPPAVRAAPAQRAVAEPRVAPEPQRPVRVVTPRPLVAEAPARPDSDWQLCQPDPRFPGYLRCGASVGQSAPAPAARPYADVRSYQMMPSYIGAPNARIIHLETDDD